MPDDYVQKITERSVKLTATMLKGEMPDDYVQ